MKLDARAEAAFAEGLARDRGIVPMKPAHPPLRAGDVDLGVADVGGPIGVDLQELIGGRMLIQGTSGAGKSWTLRRLLERSSGRIQQVVVDPEGEFSALADRFQMPTIAAHQLDSAAIAILARRAREHRLSLRLDLSELDREAQMIAVAAFFTALVDAPREHWSPCLVAVDEAHLFAPFGGQSAAPSSVRKAAIDALVDLMSRGRKRGLCGVLATQRLARLAKSVASEVHNFLIGLNTLDLDIRRAAETIGWDARRAFDRLPTLRPGDFVVVGPAFNRSPAVARIGTIETHQGGATPRLPEPVRIDGDAAAALLDVDGLIAQSDADQAIRDEQRLAPGHRAVRQMLRERDFPAAARAWTLLLPLAPEGARITELAATLDVVVADLVDALDLLDGFGVLEFTGRGEDRAVRVARGMRA